MLKKLEKVNLIAGKQLGRTFTQFLLEISVNSWQVTFMPGCIISFSETFQSKQMFTLFWRQTIDN